MSETKPTNSETPSTPSKEKLPGGNEPGVLLLPSQEKLPDHPDKTWGLALPAFIKKREKILFVTGIHLNLGVPFLVKMASLIALRRYGFDPEIHDMHWSDRINYDEKEDGLKEDISKSGTKFLVGISAGSTPSILLHAQGMVDRIVTLAGWCQPETPANTQYLKPLTNLSLSFGQAVEKLAELNQPLTAEQLKRILNFWSSYDLVVPQSASAVTGAMQEEVPWKDHRAVIAGSLLMRAKKIADHFKT